MWIVLVLIKTNKVIHSFYCSFNNIYISSSVKQPEYKNMFRAPSSGQKGKTYMRDSLITQQLKPNSTHKLNIIILVRVYFQQIAVQIL